MTDGRPDALDIAIKALRDFEADACCCTAPPGGHRGACPARQHRNFLDAIDAALASTPLRPEEPSNGD
jgi:hypothetical protein